jgi:hypothetical protein
VILSGRAGAGGSRRRLAALLGAGVLMVLGQVLTWFLLRSQGGDLGGDQAHYLIAGQAVSHLSLHPLPDYGRDFLTHFIYDWPHGAAVTNQAIVQTYPGPHGAVFAHGLGLPLLLGPFIALGSVPLGLLGLFALTALGFLCIHQRASRLAGLGRRGQVVFALTLAAPAVWLEATQVYPDLISGVLLACALVEIAWLEQQRRLSVFGAVVITATLGFVPWLQIKNLAPAVCGVIALAVIGLRSTAPRRALLAMAAVVVAAWGLLFVYNQYFFGHLVGLPQPNPTFTLGSASNVLALVFDRHQGVLVQVPTVVIGLLGLWVARRVIPWAAGAAVVGTLSMLVINGTYTSTVPFGGVALAGRFEWTVLPMLLARAPFLLVKLEQHRARLAGVGLAVAALWLAQGVPVLLGDHVYINATFAPFTPWDPTLYPGWWPGVGQFLPVFLAPSLHLGATWSHLLVEVLLLCAGGLVLVRLSRPEPIHRVPLAPALVALAAAVVVVLALGPTRTQPPAPLTWSGPAIGAPWTAGDQATAFPPVPLADVGPGTYRATVTYDTAGGGTRPAAVSLLATHEQRSVVSNWLTLAHPTDAALLSVTPPPLDLSGALVRQVALGSGSAASGSGTGSHRHAVIVITTAHQSLLSFRIRVAPHDSVVVETLRLSKLPS